MAEHNRHAVRSYIRNITSLLLVLSFMCSLCSCTGNRGGFDGTKFASTRHISVLADSPEDPLADYIHDQVLADCNIDVKFVSSDYFSMEYGIVPDIAYTGNADKITTYYRMNSVKNISPYLEANDQAFSDLKGLLGDENIYYCTDDRSEVWYLKAKKNTPDSGVTFIRADWLDVLGLDIPSTKEEFHDCLIAFRDNADLLLGEDASEIIPFFVDNEPNISCKPFFDSFYDPSISDCDFYIHGYCRATQDEYRDALITLNEWYHQDLLPEDFQNIVPNTKESYEPIENGFVGAFCAQYDYLYKNGENSHISALQKNKGKDARYIAVNTFENTDGEYTYWQEDYLEDNSRKIFLTSTCSDPLACLVYLNWLSNPENTDKLRTYSYDSSSLESFLIIYQDIPVSENDAADTDCELALDTALSVKVIQRGNKCVRYGPDVFASVKSDIDLNAAYQNSTSLFTCGVISAAEEDVEAVYSDLVILYALSGSKVIFDFRVTEWNKVIVFGNMEPL